MLTVRERPMTPAERDELRESRDANPTVAAQLSRTCWLSLLIGIPLAVAIGLVGVNVVPALMLGLAGGCAIPTVRFGLWCWAERLEKPHRECLARAVANGVTRSVSISPWRAWSVIDVEDVGPAYLFDAGGPDVLFVCSQELPDCDGERVPIGNLEVDYLPDGSAISLICHPGSACVSGVISVSALQLDGLPAVAVIPRTRLPGDLLCGVAR